MQQTPPPIAGDPAELDQTFARLKQDAGDEGFFERLDDQHTVQFIDGDDTLLVCFEHIGAVMGAARDNQPLARRVQSRTGCAQLSLLTSDDTWFRADAVYKFFDDLVDDGFFDEFNRVLFFGAGPEGYAAAAYSVVASDAEVLLIQPQATLTPRAAGWDRRFPHTRMMDFTQRYGYAPSMIETAGAVVVVFDPAYDEDFMHAQLFERDWVHLLRARHLGAEGGAILDQLGLLDQLLDGAVANGLNPHDVAMGLRARRTSADYLHAVMDHAEATRRAPLIARVQRFASQHSADGRFETEDTPPDPEPAPNTANTPSAALAALAVGGALTMREAKPLPHQDAIVVLDGKGAARDTAETDAPETETETTADVSTSSSQVDDAALDTTATDSENENEDETEAATGDTDATAPDTTSAPDPEEEAETPEMMAQPSQPWDSFALARGRGTVAEPIDDSPCDCDAADQDDPLEEIAQTPVPPAAPTTLPPAQQTVASAVDPAHNPALSTAPETTGPESTASELTGPETTVPTDQPCAKSANTGTSEVPSPQADDPAAAHPPVAPKAETDAQSEMPEAPASQPSTKESDAPKPEASSAAPIAPASTVTAPEGTASEGTAPEDAASPIEADTDPATDAARTATDPQEPPAAKPSFLNRLRADIQRRRGHSPTSSKSRRPGKRKL